MTAVVVDASVAVKWVVQEDHSACAVRLLAYQARHAPAHWQAEAVNALWSKVFKRELPAEDAAERASVLLRAPVIGASISELMPLAFSISVAQSVTVYDSLYLALAEKLDIPLVTADRRLIARMAGSSSAGRLIWVGDVQPAS
ncbi:MAG TPA: type II toxin-antitoxin system VapC family toxin [Acetobacteraceae bacterium]|nr:type II toxin-antitoxin system VapC family toxin [Acetobacteraceae bacterium]